MFPLKFWRHVSIEPAFFFHHLSFHLTRFVTTNLYLQKKCRLNATAEPNLQTPCDDQNLGIAFVTYANSYWRFASAVLIALLTIFVAAWSDKAGKKRKPFIILQLVGQTLHNVALCLQSYFWRWPPIVTAVTECAFESVSGFYALNIFAILHICDISTKETRTTRITLLGFLNMSSLLVGRGVSGSLLRRFGFFYTYSISLSFSVFATVCGILLMKDVSTPVKEKFTVGDVFSISRIVESVKVVFKKRPGNQRLIIQLLFLINTLSWFTYLGEDSILYLYFRHSFRWNEENYSAYETYRRIIIIVGTIFSSLVLSKAAKIQDGLIGALAGFLDGIALMCYFFATKNWHFYLIPLLDAFYGVALYVSDSFQSKFFDSSETGRLFSVHIIFSFLVSLSAPTYNILFKNTMDSLPGAIFLIGAPSSFLVCILYWICYFLNDHKEEFKV